MLRSAFSALIGLEPSAISITTSAAASWPSRTCRKSPARANRTDPDAVTVELRDVTFAYPGGEPVLEHVDFHAAPGEVVALTGPSGEGKTTMIRLMLGPDPPGAGQRQAHRGGRTASPASAATRAAFSYSAAGQHRLWRYDRRQPAHGASEATMRARLCLRPPARMILFPQLPDGIYARTGGFRSRPVRGQAQRIAAASAPVARNAGAAAR